MKAQTRNRFSVFAFLTVVFAFGVISLFFPNILIDNVPALQAASETGQSSTTGVRVLITAADVIVGSLLTIFLGWVYLRQNHILDSQSEILKAAHHPLLQAGNEPEPVEENPVSDKLPGEVLTDGEWVKINLRNTGNDVATDLQLRCLVVIEGDYEAEFNQVGNDLLSMAGSPQTSAGASSIQADGKGGTFFASTGVVKRQKNLEPVERIRAFLDSTGIREWNGYQSKVPLGNLLEDLTNSDNISEVVFGFAITYQSTVDTPTDDHQDVLYLEPAKRLDEGTSLSNPSLKAAWEQGDQYWIERLRRRSE